MAEQSATATLERTGLEVTRLGYGAMEFRGGPRGRRIGARPTLHAARATGGVSRSRLGTP